MKIDYLNAKRFGVINITPNISYDTKAKVIYIGWLWYFIDIEIK